MTLPAVKTTTIERLDIGLREIKLDDDGAGRFSGYGAIFGNPDSRGDVIRRGAFANTLKEWKARGKWPPMLLQHGGGLFGGTADDMVPIGKWTSMEENRRGLKVEGDLFALDTDRGKYIYEGLKSEVLDGLSIGYVTVAAEYGTDPDEPPRTLTEIDLWEVSIVTFPANSRARIAQVKALSVDELRDLETTLRERGLSLKDRKTAVSLFKSFLQRDAGVVPEHDDPPAPLRDVTADEVARELESLADAMFAAAIPQP